MVVGGDSGDLGVGHCDLRVVGRQLEVLLVLFRAVVAAREREDQRIAALESVRAGSNAACYRRPPSAQSCRGARRTMSPSGRATQLARTPRQSGQINDEIAGQSIRPRPGPISNVCQHATKFVASRSRTDQDRTFPVDQLPIGRAGRTSPYPRCAAGLSVAPSQEDADDHFEHLSLERQARQRLECLNPPVPSHQPPTQSNWDLLDGTATTPSFPSGAGDLAVFDLGGAITVTAKTEDGSSGIGSAEEPRRREGRG